MKTEWNKVEEVSYVEELIKVLCDEPHYNVYGEPVPCRCTEWVRTRVVRQKWVPVHVSKTEITPLDEFDF